MQYTIAQAKYGVYIGRFQPFHNGHYAMLQQILLQAEKVIIVLGSARSASTIKNPWSTEQRREMIMAALTPEEAQRVLITEVRDHYYNEHLWLAEVIQAVAAIADDEVSEADITLFGYEKDDSSYYLNRFPQWKYEEIVTNKPIDATDIRALLFGGSKHCPLEWTNNLPKPVSNWIERWSVQWGVQTPEYEGLVDAYQHIAEYRARWKAPEKVPFPVTFNTVDCVVIKSGHILLVERGFNPGKGLLALPGGFLNPKERLFDAALRELKEETRIVLAKKTLEESLKDSKVFDHPERSLRGRTITHAFFIDLGIGQLPIVRGGDDAAKAMWMPLHRVYESQDKFFEDHFHIIEYFTRK